MKTGKKVGMTDMDARWGVARAGFAVAAAMLSWTGCVLPRQDGCPAAGYAWITLAGQAGGLGNVDGKGAEARFCQPMDVAFDADGNVVVADYYNYAVRKIARDGTVSTLAGCVGEPGSSDGLGNAARFDRPQGVAVDASNTVYVADSGNHTIRKISADGVVTTLAGRAGEPGSADGAGREARFRSPQDVAVDAAGNVFVADMSNHVIRKITPAGAVTTLAGKVEMKNGSPVGGHANGSGGAARFRSPRGLTVDRAGNVFVADMDNAVVRKITPAGVVTTVAGCAGTTGYANGTGAVVRFSAPLSVAADASGNLFVADSGNLAIRRITPSGVVSTLTNAAGKVTFASPRGLDVDKAGTLAVADNDAQTVSLVGRAGKSTVLAGCPSASGSADGKGSAARFNRPCGIAVDAQKNLTVIENFNQTARRITPDGVVTTVAGRVWSMGAADGKGKEASFSWPTGAAQDRFGNVFVADTGNHTIRKMAPGGVVTTFAGSAGANGSADGTGAKARFSSPSDVALDASDNLYVADRGNHVIRKITPAGEVTTLAGRAGKPGRADGIGGAARFNGPMGVTVDPVGNVLVADTGNHTVRRIVPGGAVTTLAGCAAMKGGVDGVGVQARFNGPSSLVVDQSGAVFVADRDNHMIRKVMPDGGVTTVGGLPNVMSGRDGFGTDARFAQPSGIAIDGDGVLYVADACNNRIVAGYPAGKTGHWAQLPVPEPVKEEPYAWSVFAGQPGASGTRDGKGAAARLSGPQGMAVGGDGALYVVDGVDNAVRKVTPEGDVITLAGTRGMLAAPLGIGVDRENCAYVSDATHVLWKISGPGRVALLAGSVNKRGSADGTGTAARFNFMTGVASDPSGYVYVADLNNFTLRKVSPDGKVTTFAGCAGSRGCYDGAGSAARFMAPTAVASEHDGRVYVADNNAVRLVTAQGVVTTLRDDAERFGRLDGLAVDRVGNVYAADRKNHVIWKVTLRGAIVKLAGSELAMGGAGWLVTGLAVDRSGNIYVADPVRNCIMKGVPQTAR